MGKFSLKSHSPKKIRNTFQFDPSLTELFEAQVSQTPDRVALVFEEEQYSYIELEARANTLAWHLITENIGPEDVVGILLERSSEMIVAILAVLKTGAAYLPIDPDYPIDRLAFILEDTTPHIILTTTNLLVQVPDVENRNILALDNPAFIAKLVGQPTTAPGNCDRSLPLRPHHPAYIIYTSGSTGTPKGVINTHQNVVHLFKATTPSFDFNETDIWTMFHSYAFDFSVWEIWGALLRGGCLVVVPRTVAQSPEAFRDLLARHAVTVLNQTPSAFYSFIQADEDTDNVDNKLALKTIIFGGETLDIRRLEPWYQRYHNDKPQLFNMYGITEITIHATLVSLNSNISTKSSEAVIGTGLPHLQVHVLDSSLKPCPVGVTGELYIAGNSLARGYWQRPSLTAERFIANPFSQGERLYRSGDRASRRSDGILLFHGRTDHQVKIRGFRIEPGEIEETLVRHPDVAQAAVIAHKPNPSENRLVAYITPSMDTTIDLQSLRSHLIQYLPDYMVPSAYVILEALPLTPNGKLDRQALPTPDGSGLTTGYVAPNTPEEVLLCDLVSTLLEAPQIGLADHFFHLGGHSLTATRLAAQVRDRLGRNLPIRTIFEQPVLGDLAQAIRNLPHADNILTSQNRPKVIPLSFAQARLWFIDQLEEGSPGYNIPLAVHLSGTLDPTALEQALDDLIIRHESLRTLLVQNSSEPCQQILPPKETGFQLKQHASSPECLMEDLALAAWRSFQLATEIPFRAELFQLNLQDHALVLVLHHTAADGWSVTPLLNDLAAAYTARVAAHKPDFAPLPVQYADYTLWRTEQLGQESDPASQLSHHIAYWRETLKGLPVELALPTNRPRPVTPNHPSGRITLVLPAQLHAQLYKISLKQGVTLFMTLQAGLAALFSRLGAGNDIPIGAAIAGRTEAVLDNLIGFFVNTLVLRTDTQGDPTFYQLLARARTTCLGAYTHQDLPFERLVELIDPPRTLGRQPLFQTMLVLHNTPQTNPLLSGLDTKILNLPSPMAKFDLSFSLTETQDTSGQPAGLTGELEYNADLFVQSTVEAIAARWILLLEQAVTNPSLRLHQLDILTPKEREQLIINFNDTNTHLPVKNLIQIFEAQVRRTPDRVALIFGSKQLSYAELEARANMLAWQLIAKDIGPEDVVATLLQRSEEMIIALLAIFKSGATWLPLDPSHPAERLAFVLSDASPKAFLTVSNLLDHLPLKLRVITFTLDCPEYIADLSRQPILAPTDIDRVTPSRPEHPAYLIYTSGSTGHPKGVVISQQSIAHYIEHISRKVLDENATCMPLFTPAVFDLTLTSIFAPLCVGGQLHIYPEAIAEEMLAEIFSGKDKITSIKLTPSHIDLLARLAVEKNQIRIIIVGGEALTSSHLETLQTHCPGARVFNEYGPTETTIGSIAGYLKEDDIHIGRPYPNTKVYVLDGFLNPCPVGVIGELYLAGIGLARGYWQRPGLTAERFIANPFSQGKRLYRSGDLASWRNDGILLFHGRTDHQVKIRGFRIEPGEIEETLVRHPDVAQAAVIAHKLNSDENRLVAYITPCIKTEIDLQSLRSHLLLYLPDYMLPSAFMVLKALPLTANGKLDRQALPEPEGSGLVTEYIAPASAEEVLLCDLISELLEIPQIGIADHFFHLGGHSLMATRLAAQIRDRLGRNLPIRTIFEQPILSDLAHALAKLEPLCTEPTLLTAEPTLAHDSFPLTPVQSAYWLGRQNLVALGEVACHAYSEFRICPFDLGRFTDAWRTVIERHSMLRTVIQSDGTQRVLQDVPSLEIAFADYSQIPLSQAEAAVIRIREAMAHATPAYDHWPLFEIKVTRVATEDWRLHFGIDALILDGESTSLLLQEVFDLYYARTKPKPPSHLSFRDYVLHLQGPAFASAVTCAQTYWKGRINNLPSAPALPLAVDPSRLTEPHFSRRHARLHPSDWHRLKARAAAAGLTPSNILLTAYAEVVGTWSRSNDFTLNLTVGDRRILAPEIEGMLGVFTNLTPLEIRSACLGTFRERALTQQNQLVRDLDHRAFSGVEVQRMIAQRAGDPHAGLLPVVFTSMIGETQAELTGKQTEDMIEEVYSITETPQTWLDNKVYELGNPLEENFKNGLAIDWDAPEALFPEGLLDAMFNAYIGLLEALAAPGATGEATWNQPDRSLLPDIERILFSTVNATTHRNPLANDLLHTPVFAAAQVNPSATAVIANDITLSFGELETRSLALAHQLNATLEPTDCLVAIVMEKGLEQIIAALAILEAGRAFLPISAGQPDQRIQTILSQSGTKIAIIQPHLRSDRLWRNQVQLIEVPDAAPVETPQRLPQTTTSADIAYVIYTSGSTGVPKGVTIQHCAARNTLSDLTARFDLDSDDRVLWVSSFEFDLSIFDIFGILAVGGAVVIPPPDGHQNPTGWAEAIALHKITVWNSVPAIGDLMLSAITQNTQNLLHSLRLILLSGDWIPLNLPDRFKAHIHHGQVISLGGATEASIWSIFHPVEEISSDWVSIPYGKPLLNQTFYILKDDLSACPVYTTGRLFIGGTGLALGYWNDPEQTNERFIYHPQTNQRIYDTGDLGRYKPDGSIEFLGREDHQIKLRGFRIELGEIEATLTTHPQVQSALVVLQNLQQAKRIIAYVVPKKSVMSFANDNSRHDFGLRLRIFLESKLPDYMVPSSYTILETLPLTINGKLDRKSLPSYDDLYVTGPYIAPKTPTAITLCKLVAELLGLQRVGISDNFFHLGGDSIDAVRLVSRAREKGILIIPKDIFFYPILDDLLKNINQEITSNDNKLDPNLEFFEKTEIHSLRKQHSNLEDVWPLTPLQEGLWFHAQFDGIGEDPYLVQLIFEFEGLLDTSRLHCTFDRLLKRHQSLRISLQNDSNTHPVQIVHNNVHIPWDEYDLSEYSDEERILRAIEIENKDRQKKFSLSKPPLLRAILLHLGKNQYRLLLSQHHLLGDGWSTTIMLRDLRALYEKGSKSSKISPPVAFRNYLVWLKSQNREVAENAWRTYLLGIETATLIVPEASNARPQQAQSEMVLPNMLTTDLSSFARQHSLTLATVLQGAWGLLLARRLNCLDVCFGNVSSGRHAPITGIENMLGLLITTTPIRLRLNPSKSLASILEQLQQDQASLQIHQHLPLTEINKLTGLPTLFDTLFTYENYPVEVTPLSTSEETLPLSNVRGRNSNHYPLSLSVIPGENLGLRLHYNASLFNNAEIEIFASQLVSLLEQIASTPSIPVYRLTILTKKERKQLITGFNDTSIPSSTGNLVQLFEEQVKRTPDSTAVVFEEEQFNYAELDARANMLAWQLIAEGIGPEEIVAILLERSSEMIVAILAVLKAGAAYLPLDPEYPQTRLEFMLKDTAPQVILTSTKVHTLIPDTASWIILMLDDLSLIKKLAGWPTTAPRDCDRSLPLQLSHPAYIIYTSGSTGIPKGVVISHSGLSNLIIAQGQHTSVSEQSRILQLASISFDAAISEITMALCHGATLIIAPQDSRAGETLEILLASASITHVTFTPTVLKTLTVGFSSNLREVLVAGEILPSELVSAWAKHTHIYNAYGPTENTVCTTMSFVLSKHISEPPIGSPLPNTRVYVLDASLQPCAIGVKGELYIAGVGLARGYWHHPSLTAERFIANPFSLGERLYRTGDLASWHQSGILFFHGRTDHQVKIRGFRIEPQEIEATLSHHPDVSEATVITYEDNFGTQSLASYIVPNLRSPEMDILSKRLQYEQIELWRELEDDGRDTIKGIDPSFDTTGWNSSYDDKPLPNDHMRSYIRSTVDRIRSLNPTNVLEIGCGSGLIMFELLHCNISYTGSDLSKAHIRRIQDLQSNNKLISRFPALKNVKLWNCPATELEEIVNNSFDTIVLASVVQYFPSINYLLQVLEQVIDKVLVPEGSIFIGDVRSLPLLETFHASVENYKANSKDALPLIANRIRKRIEQEKELAIEPAFFLALQNRFPTICQIEVLPKCENHLNEITCFRYDVIIRMSTKTTTASSFKWIDWRITSPSLEDIRASLLDGRPTALAFKHVKNALVAKDFETASLILKSTDLSISVLDLKIKCTGSVDLNPNDIKQLGKECGYSVDISLASSYPDGSFDAVFRRRDVQILFPIYWDLQEQLRPWQDYANSPISDSLRQNLGIRLREYLQTHFPSYMQPAILEVLSAMPLTSNGKLDRKALPKHNHRRLSSKHVLPKTSNEIILCDLVANLLGLPRVEVDDNFFHLGGDSISSIRLVSRARELDLALTPRDVFLHPILGELSQHIKQGITHVEENQAIPVYGSVPATPVISWLLSKPGMLPRTSQSIILQTPIGLRESVLITALQALFDHHDALRLRIRNKDKLFILPNIPQSSKQYFRRISTAGLDNSERYELLVRTIDNAASNLDPYQGPLIQCLWAEAEAHEPGRLILVIHHIAIDGVSWRILLTDLVQAYNAIDANQPIVLPLKTSSFRSWAQNLTDSIPDRRFELPFWLKIKQKPTEPLLEQALDPLRDTARNAVYIERKISLSTTKTLLTLVPTAFHARINDVLLCALMLATSSWNRERNSLGMRIDLEGHGRETTGSDMNLTRTVGWFSSMFPVYLDPGIFDLSDAFAGTKVTGQVLKRIKEQLRSYPDNGIGYGILRYLDKESGPLLCNTPESEISFNYLGRFPVEHGADWQPTPESGALAGGLNPEQMLDHAISINAITHDTNNGPTLNIHWCFAARLIHKHDAIRFADLYGQALEALVHCASLVNAGGHTPSDYPLIEIDQEDIEIFEGLYPDLMEIWPLTPLQEGLLFHADYQRAEKDQYIVQLILECKCNVDFVRLRHSLDGLLTRHDSLRVSFVRDRFGHAFQIVKSNCAVPCQEYDLKHIASDERLLKAESIELEDYSTAFNVNHSPLIRATLIRLSPLDNRILLTFHHVLADGWSGQILLNELQSIYQHNGGDDITLRPKPTYRDYLVWLKSQDRDTAREAWRAYLLGIETATLIVPDARNVRPQHAQSEMVLPITLTTDLTSFARQHSLTLATILQGAWGLLLARCLNRLDICFGNVSSGRHAPITGIENMLGLLITTTPVRLRLNPGKSLVSILKQLQQDQASLQVHQHLPLTEIHKLTELPTLFDTLFTYENFPVEVTPLSISEDKLLLSNIRGRNSNHYPLSLLVIPGDSLGLRLLYNTSLFNNAEIEILASQLVSLLEQIASTPSIPVYRLTILTQKEREQLVTGFNDTSIPPPTGNLVQLFEEQVKRTPDSTALVFEEEQFNYAELDARANKLAWQLIAEGIGPEEIVAILLERSSEMIVAILAVLKAGAAYLPLDPEYPQTRLAFMLKDTASNVVLTTTALRTLVLNTESKVILTLDEPSFITKLTNWPTNAPNDSDRLLPLHYNHPAYIIYTSGSTGIPKGVVNTHQNVVRLFKSNKTPFKFKRTDTWTLFHSYAFDFSVWEMWGALLWGGRLVIVPHSLARSPAAFCNLLIEQKVTVLNLTTLALQRLIDNYTNKLTEHLVLRAIIFGGEACPHDLPGIWADHYKVLHVYGPTESTIFATMSTALSNEEAEPPIGSPLPNTHIFILDESLQPCAIGVSGELYIAGVGLARGYWNRPGLTSQHFIAHPFSPGERLYRSGDLASWRHDGVIMIHGRSDRQVKIRGFRIEPGEIEAALTSYPEITQATVIIRKDRPGEKSLTAYVVSSVKEKINFEQVRDHLLSKLPDYMVPMAYVILNTMPLTPSGKLDINALPKPEVSGLETQYVPPVSEEEVLLCNLTADLLHIPRVGLADNFFHLGGHSLMATQLTAQIQIHLGYDLPVHLVFEHPILGDLAKQICNTPNSISSFEILLPIRKTGKKPILFCIHPGTGLCWQYTNLLKVTSADQPIYGIQAKGFVNQFQLPKSLDEIVLNSIKNIQRIQPHGPYRLAGWSFGGIIAHLTATRLQAMGETIEYLILFDSYPPESVTDNQQFSVSCSETTWREIALAVNLDLPPKTKHQPLAAEHIKQLAQEQSNILGQFPLPQLKNLATIMYNNSVLASSANFAIFKGNIMLFIATRQTLDLDRSRVSPDLWRQYCTGKIRTLEVNEEHHRMMSPTALQQMKHWLNFL